MSEFSAQKINPSIPQEEKSTWSSAQSSTAVPGMDPVIAAVIEELAALTGELVSPAWAARCVSQIVRHRRVRHPIAYVVKTLQNAAEDGTLKERFLPTQNTPQPWPQVTATVGEGPAQTESTLEPPNAEVGQEHGLPGQNKGSTHGDVPPAAFEPVVADPSSEPDDVVKQVEPIQNIYRPGGRILPGLGAAGATELVRLRQQFAERDKAKTQNARSTKGLCDPLGHAA
ncbi:hypothetical protein [Nocardiopsis sp. FR6]|uniref:hypothetical protein n=1 Tax=Nocardiopsis sp. FR6 TaxID=2605986 RepID=UPI001F2A3D58|nr:hypothetical protein [Nocardiopsis sp. FR6]